MYELIEHQKCLNPKYFIEKYFYVLNEEQNGWLQDTNTIVSLGEARGSGRSTFLVAKALHQALFNHDQNVLMLFPNLSWMRAVRQLLEDAISILPLSYRSTVQASQLKEINFNHGSSIFSGLAHPCIGRGRTLTSLMIDGWEHLSHDRQREILTASMPSLYPPAQIYLTGTLDGWNE